MRKSANAEKYKCGKVRMQTNGRCQTKSSCEQKTDAKWSPETDSIFVVGNRCLFLKRNRIFLCQIRMFGILLKII